MYTETNNFSIRNVILQFLFIALFVFILIWLFPMKSDMKKAISSIEKSENNNDTAYTVLLDRIFNENLMAMKESAQSYYTTARLPQKVGDTTKITLREMLNKKIILPFTDKNGKQCDLDKSYVQITKEKDEFVMKVNLKCGEEENYLIVYMGCYDYCSQTICQKKGTTAKVYKAETKKTTSTKTTNVVKPQYRTLYEYKKTTKGTEKWSDWSAWSITKVNPSDTVEVETKTETHEETGYTDWSAWSTTKVDSTSTREVATKTEVKTSTSYSNWSAWSTTKVAASDTVQVETKQESKTVKEYSNWSAWSTTKVTASDTVEVQTKTETKQIKSIDYTKPIYETQQVVIGSKTVKTCSLYNVSSSVTGFNETYVGMQKFSSLQTSTALIRYELVGTYNWYCDGNCTAGKTFVYKVYQRTPVTTSSVSCAKYDTIQTVILGNRTVITGYETKTTDTPVTYYRYRTISTNDNITTYYRYRKINTIAETVKYYRYRDLIKKGETVTYYRYRTKTVTPDTVSLKWSTYNDTKLLNDGYNYTGNTKTERIK